MWARPFSTSAAADVSGTMRDEAAQMISAIHLRAIVIHDMPIPRRSLDPKDDAILDDGYAAWVWLTTGRASLDGAKPLTLLGGGEIDRVAKAAEGDKQGDFA